MKKRRPDEAYFLDMKNAIELALSYTQGMSREKFGSSSMCQSAVIYQLAVLGEAAKQISKDFRSSHGELPWKEITTSGITP